MPDQPGKKPGSTKKGLRMIDFSSCSLKADFKSQRLRAIFSELDSRRDLVRWNAKRAFAIPSGFNQHIQYLYAPSFQSVPYT